jgi:hypothetical protein
LKRSDKTIYPETTTMNPETIMNPETTVDTDNSDLI